MNNREAFDELLYDYWSLAYKEGKTGESQGDKANEVLHKLRTVIASQAQQPSIEDQRAKLVVNMVKYLGATKTQAKAIVDGVFDGENTVKELFLFQDLPNTLAGFLGGCAGSGVTPTQQMIYDAGVKSGMNRIQSQAQQPINIRQIVKNAILSNSHPAENWYLAFNDAEEIDIVSNQVAIALPNDFGDPYQGAREDLAIWKKRALEAESKLQSQAQQESQAARLLLLKLEIELICDDVKYAKDAKLAIQKLDFSKFASLPPAAEVCSDGGKCGAGGYCITCPNMPAPEGVDK